MAGRPRKDPTGADLAPMNLKVLAQVKEIAANTARSNGLTLTDYVCLLIAEDNRDQLPSTVVPMRQEVMKLRDSA
ncbi:hypothetical protein [Gordonia sp. NPDC127522]|uniref:hypothetical protein n=1 Tax=Gordonia sp. NPDC127522 TaxID=3345390 RepID=UPI0036412D9B